MKERPIIFNDEMVRAILDGRKTQTRRLVPKWQLPTLTQDRSQFISVAQRHPRWRFGVFGLTENDCMQEYNRGFFSCCPYGWRGDRLWVREAFNWSEDEDLLPGENHMFCQERAAFKSKNVVWRADGDRVHPEFGKALWRPSIHMPRWASRITLEITRVKVEKLQDIKIIDVLDEGVKLTMPNVAFEHGVEAEAAACFSQLWESIYGPGSWNANPWVWVIEFRRIP